MCKIFLHYIDTAVFALGYFISSHPVHCVQKVRMQLFFLHICKSTFRGASVTKYSLAVRYSKSVCLSVCLSVTRVSAAQTADFCHESIYAPPW